MTPFETLLVVFGVLVVGGTSYELYNETSTHYRSKHHHRSERLHHKSESKTKKSFFGLFKKSSKNKSKSKSKKISQRASRKLFNNTLDNKKTSNKLRSNRHRKHTESMTSAEKRQYYLNKFKHNVHKTKKRRRRIYI